MKFTTLLLGLWVCGSTVVAGEPGVYNVRDYGAKGDSSSDDTDAIQAAIDTLALLNRQEEGRRG